MTIRHMLEARSVAVVGASPRPGGLSGRLLTELRRSPSRPTIHLVNPKYDSIDGLACLPSLEEAGEPVDLVLMCVGDAALDQQVKLAATRGDRSALVFGSAVGDGLRQSIATTAGDAGMALCGAGCMGFVNVSAGLRAVGYLEPFPLPAGPIALVTHSGSAFSALLRADRRLGWTVAVSSGQELVTTTADYIDYALGLEGTQLIALLLETLHAPRRLRQALDRCRAAGVPVVALTVGGSPAGRAMVAAHSGALAGDDAMWEALCEAHGVMRVRGLDEMADTLELLGAGRRAPTRPARPPTSAAPTAATTTAATTTAATPTAATPTAATPTAATPTAATPTAATPTAPTPTGLACVHDSGAERTLVVDVAETLGVPFAAIAPRTVDKLAQLLDPGLEPTNPLDVWGTGAATRELFAQCLATLADDEAVDAVVLCVELVPELDGDTSYPDALLDAAAGTTKPICLLSNLSSAIDRPTAQRLRQGGVPVLEGTRSGLLALGHLLALRDRAALPRPQLASINSQRQARWLSRLETGELTTAESFALLADYGLTVPPYEPASSPDEASAAAERIGWPLVLKSEAPGLKHKTEAGGVLLGLSDEAALRQAYETMAGRLGPSVGLMAAAPPGPELSVGLVHDSLVGALVVIGAGGTWVELLADRVVALPPIDAAGAFRHLAKLKIWPVLQGARGVPPADQAAIAASVVAVATIAVELGRAITALDINPLRCTPEGAWALDVLVESRPAAPSR